MNKMSRTLGLIAATALTAGGLVACGNDVGDRQYCLDTQQEVRVEDNYCESPGEPRYNWVWSERTNYVPAYYGHPGYRYYRYPVNTRGERTQAPIRPARAATTKARSNNTDDEASSSRTYSRTGSSSGSKGSQSNTKGSSGTKGTSSGSKGTSSGSKGSSSSGSRGSSSSRR